jgi:hypothetical protein
MMDGVTIASKREAAQTLFLFLVFVFSSRQDTGIKESQTGGDTQPRRVLNRHLSAFRVQDAGAAAACSHFKT